MPTTPIETSAPFASLPTVYLDADLVGGSSIISPATSPIAFKLPTGHSRTFVVVQYTRTQIGYDAGIGALRLALWRGNGVAPLALEDNQSDSIANRGFPPGVPDGISESVGTGVFSFEMDLSFGEREFAVSFNESHSSPYVPTAGAEGHVKVWISTR